MSNALTGEGGAYTPCKDLAASLPVDPDGALVGSSGAFVSKNMLAGSQPADPEGALVGSSGGFVARPCDCCCETFSRVLPGDWGPSEFCDNPLWIEAGPSSGGLAAVNGAAGKISWADDGTPAHLRSFQTVPLTFSGVPVEYQARVRIGEIADGPFLWIGNGLFGDINISLWQCEFLGPFHGGAHTGEIDIRITIRGPDGGTAQATLANVGSSMGDTYLNVGVLCEDRQMSVKAWLDGAGIPGSWGAVAGPYSGVFAACTTPTLLEVCGGTFFGSAAALSYIEIDEFCFLQGYDCE